MCTAPRGPPVPSSLVWVSVEENKAHITTRQSSCVTARGVPPTPNSPLGSLPVYREKGTRIKQGGGGSLQHYPHPLNLRGWGPKHLPTLLNTWALNTWPPSHLLSFPLKWQRCKHFWSIYYFNFIKICEIFYIIKIFKSLFAHLILEINNQCMHLFHLRGNCRRGDGGQLLPLRLLGRVVLYW